MGGKFYAICLFLACLSALMLGYSCGGNVPVEQEKKLPQEVRYYGTVEAQGTALPEPHFETYEEYEAHVLEYVNDRKKEQ